MYRIGQDAGIAFQIKDDIFDYQKRGVIGKPTGNDIKEKKITLPLLHVINNCNPNERKRILRLISRKNKNTAVVNELIQMVQDKGGLDYATKKMNEFKDSAVKGLINFLRVKLVIPWLN